MPLRPVLTIIIGALAAYAGYWYFIAQNAQDHLRDRAAAWAQNGLNLEFASAEVSGFPYRLVITLEKPEITYTNGQVAMQIKPHDLRLVVQPWQFEHALFFASGGTIGFGKGRVSRKATLYEFSGVAASAQLKNGDLENFSIEIEAILLPARSQLLRLTGAQIHWRTVGSAAASDAGLLEPALAEFAFSASQLIVVEKSDPRVIFESLSLQATPRGTGGFALNARDLTTWRDQGGTLEIDDLKMHWEGGSLRANGSFSLDGSMRPLGLLSLKISNIATFLPRLESVGFFSDQTLRATREGLTATTGQLASEASSLSLSMQAGFAYLETNEIAVLDPVIDE